MKCKDDSIRRYSLYLRLDRMLGETNEAKRECKRWSAGWHREESRRLALCEVLEILLSHPADYEEPEQR